MRRRFAAFLATLLAAGTLAVLAPQPANAIDICAGTGTASTDPVFYPPFTGTLTPGNARLTFRFTFTVGSCVHLPTAGMGKTINAGGTFSGWCGLSSGTGMTDNGALFAWVGLGSMLVLTGHLEGLVNATPDVVNQESCSPTGTGALNFLVTGGAVLLNCHGVLGPNLGTLVPNPLGGELFHLFVNGPCSL